MKKVVILQVFSFALCAIGCVKAEDACQCMTLDNNPDDALCKPKQPDFQMVGMQCQTNKGDELRMTLFRCDRVIFDGLDMKANGEVIYENGQGDYDVFDPVKKFFVERDTTLHEETFGLQFGRDEMKIRSSWAKLVANMTAVGKAVDSFVGLVKKFANVKQIDITELTFDLNSLIPASVYNKNPSAADQINFRNSIRLVFAVYNAMKAKVPRVKVHILNQCKLLTDQPIFHDEFWATRNAVLACSNPTISRVVYYDDGDYQFSPTGGYPINTGRISFCCRNCPVVN